MPKEVIKEKKPKKQLKRKEKPEMLEEEFEKRYGKIVYIERIPLIISGKYKKVELRIKSFGKRFVLTEYFTENQLTDYVTVDYKGKTYRLKTYLEAEVMISDLIGVD